MSLYITHSITGVMERKIPPKRKSTHPREKPSPPSTKSAIPSKYFLRLINTLLGTLNSVSTPLYGSSHCLAYLDKNYQPSTSRNFKPTLDKKTSNPRQITHTRGNGNSKATSYHEPLMLASRLLSSAYFFLADLLGKVRQVRKVVSANPR